MLKIVMGTDTFRGALKVYAGDPHGALDFVGTYRQNATGDWGAETGDGQTFRAATKSALRAKIAAHINA